MIVENETMDAGCAAAHGLSLSIETDRKKILFDFGPKGTLAGNAAALGIDLSTYDLAVLSHGHDDHGGGIRAFLDKNAHAPVYVHPRAFEPHYSMRGVDRFADIGIDPDLVAHPQLVRTDDVFMVDRDLTLFTTPVRNEGEPQSNANLYAGTDDGVLKDDFGHEQSMLLVTEGKTVVVAGCAHAGILNILERVRELGYAAIDVVIGGFHMESRGTGTVEQPERIRTVGERLKETGAVFYTCHCTGTGPYGRLRETLGNRISYFKAGQILLL